jgi:hypothetical protein
MSLEESILEALTRFVKEVDLTCDTVTGFEDRTEYGGYCETCSYEYVVVDIYYFTDNGGRKTYTYDGTFSSLIRNLT